MKRATVWNRLGEAIYDGNDADEALSLLESLGSEIILEKEITFPNGPALSSLKTDTGFYSTVMWDTEAEMRNRLGEVDLYLEL